MCHAVARLAIASWPFEVFGIALTSPVISPILHAVVSVLLSPVEVTSNCHEHLDQRSHES